MPKLNVDVGVDGTRLMRGLSQTEGAVKQWSNTVRNYVAGAFSTTAIISAMSQTAGYFDNVGNAAERLDVGVEAMQSLMQMAKMAGKELGAVESMMTAIGEAQLAAIEDPTGKQGQAFAKMGMTPQMLNQMGVENVAQGLANANLGTTKGQMSQNLGDILNPKQVNMFAQMINDLADLSGKTADLKAKGLIQPEETVLQMNKAVDEMSNTWEQFRNKLAPVIEFLLNAFSNIIDVASMFYDGLAGIVNGIKNWNFSEEMEKTAQKLEERFKAYEERQRQRAAIATRTAEKGPNIEIGTGTKKKEPWKLNESERFDFMKGWKAYEPKMSDMIGSASMPMSNFLGNNMSMINDIPKQSLTELQKINKNLQDMKERMEAQQQYDQYMGFGL